MGKYLADSYDAALRENDDLKARLARELDGIKALEAVIVSRGERLAEAEALLSSDTVGLPYWCEQRDAFLAPDSAPAADRIDPADLLEIMERCPVCTAEFVKHCRKRAADRE